jgi:hypothetical protein
MCGTSKGCTLIYLTDEDTCQEKSIHGKPHCTLKRTTRNDWKDSQSGGLFPQTFYQDWKLSSASSMNGRRYRNITLYRKK